jgi:hypothetical protein
MHFLSLFSTLLQENMYFYFSILSQALEFCHISEVFIRSYILLKVRHKCKGEFYTPKLYTKFIWTWVPKNLLYELQFSFPFQNLECSFYFHCFPTTLWMKISTQVLNMSSMTSWLLMVTIYMHTNAIYVCMSSPNIIRLIKSTRMRGAGPTFVTKESEAKVHHSVCLPICVFPLINFGPIFFLIQ